MFLLHPLKIWLLVLNPTPMPLFCSQQRVFAVQVFELHRLIKVQKLIAASPELLLQSELHLGTVVYTAYMNGLLKITNSQKVVEIFERMKRDHSEPSTETYTMMINLYGKVISAVFFYILMLSAVAAVVCCPNSNN
ncbi:hypothetical protein RHMOL_Rhmol04G0187400 [Rhododendron molle]|uniref:Uncharacterized protein n=2 Tax=Rhododendron molle TaxID=49168 RepID=A0ACC0P461_RHOML|nr:hypothetical protein RHMOL_Rhmol04G0187400 [Rhododendron molle]